MMPLITLRPEILFTDPIRWVAQTLRIYALVIALTAIAWFAVAAIMAGLYGDSKAPQLWKESEQVSEPPQIKNELAPSTVSTAPLFISGIGSVARQDLIGLSVFDSDRVVYGQIESIGKDVGGNDAVFVSYDDDRNSANVTPGVRSGLFFPLSDLCGTRAYDRSLLIKYGTDCHAPNSHPSIDAK